MLQCTSSKSAQCKQMAMQRREAAKTARMTVGASIFEHAFFAFFAPLRYNELPIKYEEDVCGIILTRLKNIS